jgi:DNA-binding PucR family transcriptional regulator
VARGRLIEASRARAAPSQGRAAVHARLEARRDEIERAALTRVHSIADPKETENPEYVEGLRAAVCAAIDYGLTGIGGGVGGQPRVPLVLLEQARLAARNGVSLETVLRRYVAGYTLLGDFLIEETKAEPLPSKALQQVMRDQATIFDRLVAAVTLEYKRESERRSVSVEGRRVERIRRLLAGDILDISELAYDFEAWHLGMLAAGVRADDALRKLSQVLGLRLLLVPADDEMVWAWLGGQTRTDPVEVERAIASDWPSGSRLAIGEPAHGIGGWRFTHQQARAALPIGIRTEAVFTRYADVAVLASILQDELLATSLRELYLDPLKRERDSGKALREALRAYFVAGRNVSSAAAALGLNRRTLTKRLRTAEERFGRRLDACAADLAMALRMEEMKSSDEARTGMSRH